jgi:hypothetical protein
MGNRGQIDGSTWFTYELYIIPAGTVADNQITFVAGAGGSLSWKDNTTGDTGLTGTFGFGATDNITVTATPLAGWVFQSFTAGTSIITQNPASIQIAPQSSNYTVTANFTAAPTPPPAAVPSLSIRVRGTYYGGYTYLPPVAVRVFRRIRDRFIRKDVHKKLHPLV